MNIAEKIKAVRKAKGITPTIMARELGIEATNYPRLENRGNRLTYENLELIAKALGITVIELLTWGENVLDPIPKGSKDAVQLQERVDNLEKQLETYYLYAEAVTANHRSIEIHFNVIFDSIGDSLQLGHVEEDVYEYYDEGEKHQMLTQYRNLDEKDYLAIAEYVYHTQNDMYGLLVNLVLLGLINKENTKAMQLLTFHSTMNKGMNRIYPERYFNKLPNK